MATATGEALFLLKDVKPGSKNLNIVFIVLEIGKSDRDTAASLPCTVSSCLFVKGASGGTSGHCQSELLSVLTCPTTRLHLGSFFQPFV